MISTSITLTIIMMMIFQPIPITTIHIISRSNSDFIARPTLHLIRSMHSAFSFNNSTPL